VQDAQYARAESDARCGWPAAHPEADGSRLGSAGECFQEISLGADGRGRVENIVTWAPTWRLVGGAAWEPSQAFLPGGKLGTRAILSVDSAVFDLGGLKLDFSLTGLTKLIDRTKRELSEAEGTGSEFVSREDVFGRGWLECFLLEADGLPPLRISRDNTGFYYVHSRVTTDAEADADADAPAASAKPSARVSNVQLCAARADDEPAARSNASGVALAGLAGSATTAAVVSAAGGACVGGGCVAAGAGAAASAGAAAGGASAGAAAAAGAAASAGGGAGLVQSLLAGGALTVGTLGSLVGLPSGPPPMSDGLVAMVARSTPLEEATEWGQPTVLEFYRPACKFCNLAASAGLGDVEAQAGKDGVRWVMVDTDDVQRSSRLVRKYGVRELPHFEFFYAQGERSVVPEAGGPVDVERIAARVRLLVFPEEEEL
jgi:hypothetical protein